MGRETCFSRSAILPRLQIEIARDTPSSIAHAAPSDVSLPAVSFGGLRMPAPVCVASPSCGRHPKPAQIRKSLLSLDHVVKRITEPRPTPVFRLQQFRVGIAALQFGQLLRTLSPRQRNGSSPPMNVYRVLRPVWIL